MSMTSRTKAKLLWRASRLVRLIRTRQPVSTPAIGASGEIVGWESRKGWDVWPLALRLHRAAVKLDPQHHGHWMRPWHVTSCSKSTPCAECGGCLDHELWEFPCGCGMRYTADEYDRHATHERIDWLTPETLDAWVRQYEAGEIQR